MLFCELFVIDQSSNRGVLAAQRAFGSRRSFELAELHIERIEQGVAVRSTVNCLLPRASLRISAAWMQPMILAKC